MRDQIDKELREWRQGDCVLDEQWFVHRFAPGEPITEDAARVAALDPQSDLVESPVRGLVVLTQTCDLVQRCERRPFVEVAPLVEPEAHELPEIELGLLLRYASVPGVKDRCLVADLNRVMTVEKAVVAGWTRVPGCRTDDEVRLFAEALKRKRGRFAFPDEFNERVAAELQKRLRTKHGKNSDEGRALRALREIRVAADPSWDAREVRLFFWFIRQRDSPDFESKPWSEWLTSWLDLLKPTTQFVAYEGAVVSLADMSAEAYVESDRLDLDHLSLLGRSPG